MLFSVVGKVLFYTHISAIAKVDDAKHEIKRSSIRVDAANGVRSEPCFQSHSDFQITSLNFHLKPSFALSRSSECSIARAIFFIKWKDEKNGKTRNLSAAGKHDLEPNQDCPS